MRQVNVNFLERAVYRLSTRIGRLEYAIAYELAYCYMCHGRGDYVGTEVYDDDDDAIVWDVMVDCPACSSLRKALIRSVESEDA